MDTTENDTTEKTELPVNTAPLADVSALASDVIASAPEISQHAIETHEENEKQEKEAIESFSHLKDKDGKAFDPKIHAVDADGQPSTNKDGSLRKKRGVKAGSVKLAKPALKLSSDKTPIKEGLTDRALAPSNDDQARYTGIAMTSAIIGLSCGIFGDEWAPKKSALYDEQKHLEEATIEWVKETGYELNPMTALFLAWSSYAAPRVSQPETKKKLSKVKNAIIRKKDDKKNPSKKVEEDS